MNKTLSFSETAHLIIVFSTAVIDIDVVLIDFVCVCVLSKPT